MLIVLSDLAFALPELTIVLYEMLIALPKLLFADGFMRVCGWFVTNWRVFGLDFLVYRGLVARNTYFYLYFTIMRQKTIILFLHAACWIVFQSFISGKYISKEAVFYFWYWAFQFAGSLLVFYAMWFTAWHYFIKVPFIKAKAHSLLYAVRYYMLRWQAAAMAGLYYGGTVAMQRLDLLLFNPRWRLRLAPIGQEGNLWPNEYAAWFFIFLNVAVLLNFFLAARRDGEERIRRLLHPPTPQPPKRPRHYQPYRRPGKQGSTKADGRVRKREMV